MNVLMIFEYMPPFITGAYNRGLFYYNYFSKRANCFKVISCDFYDIKKKDHEYLKNVIYIKKEEKSKMSKLPQKLLNIGKIEFFTDNAWINDAINEIEKDVNFVPDIILISFPSYNSIKLTNYLKKKYPMSKIILDLRDPLISYSSNSYFNIKSLINKFTSKKIEKKIISFYDIVITVSLFEKNRIENVYKRKCYKLYTGYAENNNKNLQNSNLQNSKDNNINIGYFGSFSYSDKSRKISKLNNFFKFVTKYNENNNIKIEFYFYGRFTKDEINIMNRYSCCHYAGIITDKLEEKMNQYDALLIFNNNNYKGIITGKVFDYMKVGKPIILYSDQEIELVDIVEKKGGLWLNKNNINNETIDKIISLKNKKINYCEYSWEANEKFLDDILLPDKERKSTT